MRAAAPYAFLFVFCSIAIPNTCAHAQAWIPRPGEGSFQLAYQRVDVGDHLFPSDRKDGQIHHHGAVWNGNRIALGDIMGNSVSLAFDLGVTDRFALSGNASYVTSSYKGPSVENLTIDDGRFHGGVQDAELLARYVVFRSPAAVVTPFVGLRFPLRDYPILGHAAIGRNLKELPLGIALGRTFAPWASNVYGQARYTRVFSESVGGFDLNRHEAALQVGMFVLPQLSLQAFGQYLDTDGGIDWGNIPLGQKPSHDVAARTRAWSGGGGLSFEIARGWSMVFAVSKTIAGKNTHDGTAYTVSTGRGFGPLFGARRGSGRP